MADRQGVLPSEVWQLYEHKPEQFRMMQAFYRVRRELEEYQRAQREKPKAKRGR